MHRLRVSRLRPGHRVRAAWRARRDTLRGIKRALLALAAGALCALIGLPGAAFASDELWALLKGGGQVILMRHAITTPGVGDPPGMRLDDCSTQRNLTDEGRRHARQAGEALRARGVPVDRVVASPWCRCVETARLAFGTAETSPALGNLYGNSKNSAPQVRAMQALIAERRGAGNLILVSHGSTISALTGEYLDTAEMLVVTPQDGGRLVSRGRIAAHRP